MLTFNQLLQRGGLDLKDVRLVRHRDPTPAKHRLVARAAFDRDPRFHEYQELQGTEQVIEAFRVAKHLASFIVEPGTHHTLFVGVWDRLGERPMPAVNSFGWVPRAGAVAFETRLREEFDAYRGRIVIDWGDGTRAWVQRADKQDKAILEIRRVREEPKFPGFASFRESLSEVETIPLSWAEVLRNARGIYLLVHRESGEQYVGSAYGAGGFLGRWQCYTDGHGGNIAMRELGAPAEAYDVSILEVMGSDADDADVIGREALWKVKLGTRAKGLNRN